MVEPRAAPPRPHPDPLPDFHSRVAVAEFLGLEPRRLAYWAWVIRDSKRYKRFPITKRNGNLRYIDAPVPPLKEIQRKLNRALTAAYRPPIHVHGFTPTRSPLTNSDIHIGQSWVFAVDLEDFFPTITKPRVRGMFRKWPFDYPDDVAELLSELCCHEGSLPQGAPTSPIISNYLCRSMDRELGQLAQNNSCYYSRYADDLVFSTNRRGFPTAVAVSDGGLAQPGLGLRTVINRAGFKFNATKTRMQSSIQRQRVTGLIVNEKRNLPRDYIRGLRALLHIWKRYGAEDAASSLRRASPDPNWPPGKPYPNLAVVARGRLQYIGAVRGWSDPVYLKLAVKLADLDPHFEIREPSDSPREFVAHLYTEGISDVRHIRAALSHFHESGEFANLKLVIDEDSAIGDDRQLAEYARGLGQFGTGSLGVCLFDSDTKAALAAVGEHGWEMYGSKTVAVGLAPPPFRDPHEKLCIEMLYEDAVLQTKDDGGRRIYLTSEFKPTSVHESEKCTIPRTGSDALIAPKVFAFDSDDNLARSKTYFAKAIEEEPESFSDLSFDGFRPTFQRIITALEALPSEWTRSSR
jgi:RNA-directed DNA polymerase